MDVTVIDAEAGLAPRVSADDPDAADASAIEGGELVGCWRLAPTERPLHVLDVRFGATVEIDLDRVGVWFRHPTGPALLPLTVLRQRMTDGRLGRTVRLHVPAEVDLLALLRFATVDELQRAWDRLPGAFGMGGGAETAAPEAPEEEAPEEAAEEEPPPGPSVPAPPVIRGAEPPTPPRPGRRRGPVFGMDEAAEEAAPEAAEEAAPEFSAAAESPAAGRGAEGPVAGGGPPPRTALAHLQGEMPQTVVVDRPFPVRFSLSRRPVAPTPGFGQASTVASVDVSRAVTVTIVPRGFRMAADEPRTIDLELPGSDDDVARHEFTLVAPEPGFGEVALIVRQGADLPLATLRLTAEAVAEEPGESGAATPRTVEAAVTRPDRELLALPSIRVDEELVDGVSTLSIRASVGRDSADGTMRLPDKGGYVSRLYRRIDGIRSRVAGIRDTQRRADAALRELSRLGRAVAADVLPPEVLEFLWTHRDELDGLIVQTTGEVDVPWEIVHLVPPPTEPSSGEDGRFLSRYGLTRWVYGTAHPVDLHVATDRAHVICPTYKLRRFQLQATAEERDLLEDRLKATLIDPDDVDAVRTVVTEGYDLLHFAGHGHWATTAPPIQELLLSEFDDEAPGRDWRYSDEDLRADLPDLGTIAEDAEGPLVFLNACDLGRLPSGDRSLGGFPEAFLRRGAGAFVGCSWSVGDDAAGSFVRAFYAALVTGETLAEATRDARTAAARDADLSDLAFAVYAHPRARLHLT
ncbi:DUF7363 domain-containing protein [Agromyces tropicus]